MEDIEYTPVEEIIKELNRRGAGNIAFWDVNKDDLITLYHLVTFELRRRGVIR